MCVAVAAGGHHEPLSGIVQNFSPAVFNKCFGSFSVTGIDIPAILYGKRFNDSIIFRSENLAIHDKIGAIRFFPFSFMFI